MTLPQNKKPLSQIFNDFVDETHALFPRTKGRLTLLQNDPPRAYGTLSRWKTGLSGEKGKAYLGELTRSSKTSLGASQHDSLHDFNIIYLDTDDVLSQKPEEEIEHILDHELGHLIVKGGRGYGATIEHEAVADAFMLIRHYQRHGTDAPFNDTIASPAARATRFMQTLDAGHFTSFTMLAIMARKDEIDFQKLSTRQARKLARKFAQESTPSPIEIKALKYAITDVSIAFRHSPEDGRRALAELAKNAEKGTPLQTLAQLLLDEEVKNGRAAPAAKTPAAKGPKP